ncbi:MAG: hypothetical protein AB7S26_31040 [Sandaracinaceae bacterium]
MRSPLALRGWSSAILLVALAAAPGCQRREGAQDPAALSDDGADAPAAQDDDGRSRRAQASRRRAAGASCAGRDDCSSDQVCVDAMCRYERTSVSGEVLVTAAVAQRQAGDTAGAIETYDLAFAAYEARGAPIPPELACGAALAILESATDPETRERGATRADLCFRTTVPGHPARRDVQQAVARLRYEGLDISLFDEEEPATRFFTGERTRPTVDAVVVRIQMPDLEPHEPPGHTRAREILDSEAGHRAVADCFIQDWELRHEAEVSGELGMRFSSRLRDMGTYDVFVPEVAIEPTTAGDDGFEPCLSRALAPLFDANDRSLRGDGWTQAIRITARVQ